MTRRRPPQDVRPPSLEPLEPRLLLAAGCDLLPTILQTALPAEIVSGEPTTIKLPVRTFNSGNVALPRGQRIDLKVFARPADALDDTRDLPLVELGDLSVSSLGPGRFKTFNVPVQLPLGMPAGQYVLGARVDTSHQVVETDEDNNTALTFSAVDVTRGWVDLTGTFGRITLPPAAAAGERLKGTVEIVVQNDGNAPLPRGQRVDLQLVARSTTDATETPLAAATNLSISALKAGQTKTLKLSANLPAGLDVGLYEIVGRLLPAGELPEEDVANNAVLLDADGQAPTILSAEPFYDLLAGVTAARLPESVVSGDGTKIVLRVGVVNLGNVPLPRGRRIDVDLLARPATAQDASQDVHLAALTGRSVSGLKPGREKTLKAALYLPLGMASDAYVLVARIDTGNAVVESDEANNEAATDAAVDVTRGWVDLTGTLGATTLPALTVAGLPLTGRARVVVRNDGNAPLPRGQRVTLQLLAVARSDGAETLLAEKAGLSVSRLAAGRTRKLSVRVRLIEGLGVGEHELIARIVPADELGEEDDANNVARVNQFGEVPVIEAAEPFVDLTADLAAARLPEAVISGDGRTIRLPLRLSNGGNVRLDRGQRIDVHVFARPHDAADDSRDVLVARAAGLSVSRLAPGKTRTIRLAVDLPLGMAPDSYFLVARADAADAVVESDETNNAAVTDAMIGIVRGFVDLQAAFKRVSLPALADAGKRIRGRVSVTVRNAGNAPLPRGQRVHLRLVARSVDDGREIVLAEKAALSLSRLKPQRTKTLSVGVNLPDGLPAGTYEVLALLAPADDLTEEDATNNTARLDLAGHPVLLEVQ